MHDRRKPSGNEGHSFNDGDGRERRRGDNQRGMRDRDRDRENRGWRERDRDRDRERSGRGYDRMSNRDDRSRAPGNSKQSGGRKSSRTNNAQDLLSAAEAAVLKIQIEQDDTLFKVVLRGTAVVTANKKTGELKLTSGRWRTVSTLGVINTALRPIRMQVVASNASETQGGTEARNGSLAGEEWELRSFAQNGSNPANNPTGKGFGWSSVSEIQSFEEDMTVDTFWKLSNVQRAGVWSVMEQHIIQTQKSIRARIKYGKTPPAEVTLSDKFFVEALKPT